MRPAIARVERSTPSLVIDAPVVLVCAPAGVMVVPLPAASRTIATISAASAGRPTASGTFHSPEASRAYDSRTPRSRSNTAPVVTRRER